MGGGLGLYKYRLINLQILACKDKKQISNSGTKLNIFYPQHPKAKEIRAQNFLLLNIYIMNDI